MRTAVSLAETLTATPLRKTDVLLTIKAESEVDVVDGPSAGAAITIAMIAAIKQQTPSRSVFITGTVTSDGTIGPIGGVAAKALAAAEVGASKFLVPIGQSKVVVYVPEKRHPFPGVTIITYRQQEINLQQYLSEKGYKVEVLEVKTISEAYRIFTAQ